MRLGSKFDTVDAIHASGDHLVLVPEQAGPKNRRRKLEIVDPCECLLHHRSKSSDRSADQKFFDRLHIPLDSVERR